MATVESTRADLTAEQVLAMSEDGVDRELIRFLWLECSPDDLSWNSNR